MWFLLGGKREKRRGGSEFCRYTLNVDIGEVKTCGYD